jgi:hypothetical protein
MLILWTDHGIMLGEHGCFAKNYQPWYEELAHTPFFIWDPRSGKQGERRQALVQPSLDLGPTLLRYFGLEPTPTMLGHDLLPVIEADRPVREAGLFGIFGRHVNVVVCPHDSEARYVYMRAPAQTEPATASPLNIYTLQTSRLRSPNREIELALTGPDPFSFSKGLPLFKLPVAPPDPSEWGTLLFDLVRDPQQQAPLADPHLEQQMIGHLLKLMQVCEAPVEQYERLGLTNTT